MKTGTIIALVLGTVVVGGAGVGAAVLLTRGKGGDQATLSDDSANQARIAEAEAAAKIARSQADAAKAQADAEKARAKAADKPFWEIAAIEGIKGISEFAKAAW